MFASAACQWYVRRKPTIDAKCKLLGLLTSNSIFYTKKRAKGETARSISYLPSDVSYRFHKNAPSPEGIMPSGCVVVQSWSVANAVPGTTISST